MMTGECYNLFFYFLEELRRFFDEDLINYYFTEVVRFGVLDLDDLML